MALMAQGKLDESLSHCRESVRLDPNKAESRNNLGVVLDRQGNHDEAIVHYREAIRLDPEYVRARNNLGLLLARRGEVDMAIHHFREVLKIDSNSREAHEGLALALAHQGRHEEAIEHYREAIRLNSENPGLYNNLAWIRATHPNPALRDGAEAVELAERACALWGKREPNLLDTLAAAYAEAGRFPEAIATAEEALSLASSRGFEQQAQELKVRLQGYRSGSAYRQTKTGAHAGGP
jgi:Flp pilus assembly protein TadD